MRTLPEQPIFYPVLVEEYADQIARTWNTKEEPFAGYVLEMELPDDYAARFTPQTVGGSIHRELWVPAESLAEVHDHLTRAITVRRAFFGSKYRGHVPDKFGLRGADAYKQVAAMIGTMDYSMFDFVCEVSTNMLTFFLNFPFWKAAGPERLRVDPIQLVVAVNRTAAGRARPHRSQAQMFPSIGSIAMPAVVPHLRPAGS